MTKDNIILVGMMGAGKTSIGKELVKKLPSYIFIDIDESIEKKTGITISEIFSKYSEDYFRDIETQTIKEICKSEKQIISTGGGAFEREINRKVLLNSGKVFYLYAPTEVLYDRIKEQSNRPLLACEEPVKKVKNLLEVRDINYRKADYIIDTTNLDIETAVNEILRRANETFNIS